MKTRFGHLQINVHPDNLAFYSELMRFLGWDSLYEAEGMAGFGGPAQESLWYVGAAKDVGNDYDGPGMNHVGIAAESIADVDAVVAWLANRGVPALFETPRHRSEFSHGESDTYYQVMFESPDRVLYEVVYAGPRDAGS